MATNVKMKSATYEQPPFHSIRICDLTAASTLEAQPCVRQARTIDKKLLNKKWWPKNLRILIFQTWPKLGSQNKSKVTTPIFPMARFKNAFLIQAKATYYEASLTQNRKVRNLINRAGCKRGQSHRLANCFSSIYDSSARSPNRFFYEMRLGRKLLIHGLAYLIGWSDDELIGWLIGCLADGLMGW